jgi:hypothetical protein
MAKELSMNGRKLVGTLRDEFSNKFNYLTLVFLDGEGKPIDSGISLSEVSIMKGPDISIVGSLKVDSLERNFKESFGLNVEVAYSKGGGLFHAKRGIDKTLNELNAWCESTGCDRLNMKDATVSKASQSMQVRLYESLKSNFPDAVAKKVDKDHFVDIHIPSVNDRYGTHLGFNTAKGVIRVCFYCRDEAFVEAALAKSSRLERYSQGLRPAGNPEFKDADSAVSAAVDFLHEIMGGTNGKEQTPAKVSGSNEALQKPSFEADVVKKTEEEYPEVQREGVVKEKGSVGNDEEESDEGQSPEVSQIIEALFSGNVRMAVNTLISTVSSHEASVEKVRQLIEEGADVNVRNTDSDAYTPVHYAAWDGKDEILKVLLDAGGDPDTIGGDGATPLHLAASLGRIHSVELLLSAGAEIDARGRCTEAITSSDGDTALRLAFIQQQWPVVDLLVAKGASLSNLLEPCSGLIEGSSDLFEVVRNEGNGQNRCLGEYDEDRTNDLEKKAKGFASDAPNVDNGKEGEGETSSESDFTVDSLDEMDIKDIESVEAIAGYIREGRYLTNLLYVNKALQARGFEVDNHQAYFFDSHVLVSDRELEGFMVVNMDGFYSNCLGEGEMQCIFSWSGVDDIAYEDRPDGCSIDIASQEGVLTIRKVGSKSLKVLHEFYTAVWKQVNSEFKEESFIAWSMVWEMGIKEVGFETPDDYFACRSEGQGDDNQGQVVTDDGYSDFSTSLSGDEEGEKSRNDYLNNWLLPSRRYSDLDNIVVNVPEWIGSLDNEGCCPKFNEDQIKTIVNIVESHKLIPVLEYAPSAFLEQVKQVWWIVPFSIYREDHASWVFMDKNGIHAAYDEDNQVRQIISWENVDFVDFREDFFDGDDNLNVMFVHLVSGGYITFAEFANEVQGSYLRVLVSIFNVRKTTIEKSRGKDSWKEGAGGEGFQAFQKPSDLMDERVWLNEPNRPDPRSFM